MTSSVYDWCIFRGFRILSGCSGDAERGASGDAFFSAELSRVSDQRPGGLMGIALPGGQRVNFW